MGRKLKETIESQGDEVLAMVDAMDLSVLEGLEEADVLIDFSHPDNFSWVIGYARENVCPLVIGTTGLTPDQLDELHALSN